VPDTPQCRLVPHPMARQHPTEDRIVDPFPDYKQILIGKVRVGYVKKGKPITTIKRIGGVELELIEAAVAEWVGYEGTKVNMPPKLVDKSGAESEDYEEGPLIVDSDGNPFDDDEDEDDD